MTISLNSKKENLLLFSLNLIGLLGISATLLVAFYYQIMINDLPCPLCLLQRVGLMLIGFGFLFNVRFGIKDIHYGFALIGCILTCSIAARQVFLHILPGDPGYGATFMGLHFYTWALITSLFAVVAIAILMMLSKDNINVEKPLSISIWGKFSIFLFAVMIVANLISTVLECGSGQCAENPTYYQLIGK